MSSVSFPHGRSAWTQGLLPCLVVFALVLATRLYYVEHFAVSLPFWDQWDSEGDFLIHPYVEGSLAFETLWAPHNEHRILPTRLTSLLLFEATGEWNNLNSARFNALLAALLAAFMVWVPTRTTTSRRLAWTLAAVVAASFSLPYAWENILVGFQSQFYYLLLFTVAVSAIAAWRPGDRRAVLAVFVISLIAVLTMASGLLTPIAAAGVFILGHYARRSPMPAVEIGGVILLIAMALIAYGTTPVVPGHAPLQAQGTVEMLDAATHMLGFPISGYHWAFLWLWLPGACGLAARLLRRRLDTADLVMAALLGWSTVQGVAIAYGRGKGLIEVPSRYTELMTPGLVASAWFIIRAIELDWRSRAMRALSWIGCIGMLTAFFGSHAYRLQGDFEAMRARHALTQVQTEHVRQYLETGDPTALQQPFLHIPYPSPDRLQQLLDTPALRENLADDVKGTANDEARAQ